MFELTTGEFRCHFCKLYNDAGSAVRWHGRGSVCKRCLREAFAVVARPGEIWKARERAQAERAQADPAHSMAEALSELDRRLLRLEKVQRADGDTVSDELDKLQRSLSRLDARTKDRVDELKANIQKLFEVHQEHTASMMRHLGVEPEVFPKDIPF